MSIKSETFRYLGYGKKALEPAQDAATERLVDECLATLADTANPKIAAKRFPLMVQGGRVQIAGMTIESQHLARNLSGCAEGYIVAATLGVGVDSTLKRYLRLDLPKAAVWQAASAAFLEDFLDRWQATLQAELAKENLFCRPRFSPGYGDCSLAHQAAVLQAVNATKTLGIVLTDGNLMLPEKSVTAFLGLSNEENTCLAVGCAACQKADCAVRQG